MSKQRGGGGDNLIHSCCFADGSDDESEAEGDDGESGDEDEDDDAQWYKQEVGEEPDPGRNTE